MDISSESESEIYLEDSESEDYNLEVAVAVAQVEGNEIEEQFTDALNEIHGEKSFPCPNCDKVCKSKGGLTRHTNSKHSEFLNKETPGVDLFCYDTISSIVESIKSQIMREKLDGVEINNSVKSASCTKAFYNALLPLYSTFCRKKNQDQLVESLFALIPQSSEMLNCSDYKAANLIMIHIPDHVVAFYNMNRRNLTGESPQTSQDPETNVEGLDQAERGPLSYIAGYVVSKLFQANKRKSGGYNEELNVLLQNMKSSGNLPSFISSRSRGGLVNPSDDLVGILESTEYIFRRHINESKMTLRNIPIDSLCNKALESPMVKSLWENILISSGVNSASSTQKLCLENIIKLFLKVRSFSYARDYLNKHKIKERKIKQKALRKDLKRSAEQVK